MKFVNLHTPMPINKVEKNLEKESGYFVTGENVFSEWSLSDYNKDETGIHASYDSKNRKICAYCEDGVDHKNFLVPITEIFTGKISEKNGVTYIKGRINMSPIFNIIVCMVFLAIAGLYIFLPEQRANVAVIFVLLVIYFIYVKKAYADLMKKIAIYLDACTYAEKKHKKNSPNKKNGKWAGKHY